MATPPHAPTPSAERGTPGAGEAGQAAGAALQALARAARSLVLYDPGNDAIRQILGDCQARLRAALALGALELEVRAYELLQAGEVVYRDPDREKSLAFKLFRDGVRRLEIGPAAPWDELRRLVEILAVRFTGVRQQEDDVVTLLRQAEFRSITFEALEGYTPDEENPEPGPDPRDRRALAFQPPATWDTPLQRLPAPRPLAWAAPAAEELARLHAEEDRDAAELALSVARDLLVEAGRAGWPTPDPELAAFLAELRDGLLAEGDLGALRALVDLVGQAGAGELREGLLARLGDARTLEAVLQAVPEDAARLPDGLVPLLPLLGIDAALDQLAGAVSEARRRLLVQLVLARLPREADAVLARLRTLDPRVVRDLARGLVARAPERAAEVARQLLGQADEALRLEGLAALEAAPGEVPLRPVAELLDDPAERVRERAAEVLGNRGDESAVATLRAALEDGRPRSFGEAEALGRALAQLAPIAAARLFGEWIEPRGRFLRGLTPAQRWQQWAAVAGLGALPGGDPEPALMALAARSEEDLKRHCQATVLRRRKEQQRGPAPR